MTAEVLSLGLERPASQTDEIGALARAETRRLLRAPTFSIALSLAVVLAVVEAMEGTNSSFGPNPGVRQVASILLFDVPFMLLGPLTFVAANLLATSARRSGTERLLGALPVGELRRDLALCLGVLAGPTLLAVAMAATSAWLAIGVPRWWDSGLPNDPALWTNIAQQPAVVLGAGVLGVVVARWVPVPGALLVGFLVLILSTGWLASSSGPTAIRPWLAPFVVIDGFSDSAWLELGSEAWHLAYLLGLSALGVCALGVRQPERRRRWLAATAVALAAVVTAGLLQLPRVP